jgi:predicted DNA-binding transcriptional regulator YafY
MVAIPSDAVAVTRREATLPSSGEPSVLPALNAALASRTKVGIRYRGGAKEDTTERTIHPYALVVSSGSWFVLAYCELAGGIRSFRLDRIESIEQTNASYEIPATFSIDEYLDDRKVLRVGDAQRMRVRYSPRIARWIAEREGREVDADGSLTVDHPLADVQWGVRHVLQYGPDATVLEPKEVRDELTRRMRALTGA